MGNTVSQPLMLAHSLLGPREFQQSLKRKREENPTDSDLPPAKRSISATQEVEPNHLCDRNEESLPPPLATCLVLAARVIKQSGKRDREEDHLVVPPAKRHASLVQQADPRVVTSSISQLQRERGDDSDIDILEYPPTTRVTISGREDSQSGSVSLLVLPNELLQEIIGLLGRKDLRTCTQVSLLLKSMAGPRFLDALKFRPCGGLWMHVDRDKVAALMVWRRMADFARPKQLYCTFTDTQDHHLQVLEIFFQEPRCANIPVVYLSFYGKNLPASSLLSSLLTTIKTSGCLEISYSARSDIAAPPVTSLPWRQSAKIPSQLQAFSSDSNIIFSPSVIPFTLSTLRHSPLRELTLKGTGLPSAMWAKLLRTLSFPALRRLEIDSQCSVSTLLTFLQHHRRVQSLSIHADGDLKVTRPWQRSPINLPSLHSLSGPPEYLIGLVQCFERTESIASLSVEFTRIKPGSSLISKVLDCAEYLPHVRDIGICLYQSSLRVIPMASLTRPKYERQKCGTTRLRITAGFDAVTDGGEDVIKYCAPWMTSFPDVKSLILVPGSSTLSDVEIAGIRNTFIEAADGSADELNVKISVF